MKRKRILLLVAIVILLVAIVVTLASVYSVREAMLVFHNFDGTYMSAPSDAPTANDVLQIVGGDSTVFMRKSLLLSALNQKFTQWHAFAVVKHSPDLIEVHFVKRVAMVKVNVGGSDVYLDSFGFVTAPPEGYDCIDVSSAFQTTVSATTQLGTQFTFANSAEDARLQVTLKALMALWQCNTEVTDMSNILGDQNVFSFDGVTGDLIVTTKLGAKIIVKNPEDNLVNRLIPAFGVYYSNNALQMDGIVITVQKNGQITAPQD